MTESAHRQPDEGPGLSPPPAASEQPDVTLSAQGAVPGPQEAAGGQAANGPATSSDPAGADAGPAPELDALLEAVLLVADEPVPAVVLAQVVEQPTEAVEAALQALADRYAARGSGIELRRIAGGWRWYTHEVCAPWVERFVRDGQQARLTQAALETLAVVAYRQPVTRARVSAVRGVNVDGVFRTLVARGLVAEVGTDADTGGTLYGTTPLLLQKLGLDSLAELPSLAPLLPELDQFEEDSMST